MGKREETRLRQEFSNNVLKAISGVAKQSGWRKFQESLIRVDSDFFFESKAYVYLSKVNIQFTFSAKPFAADTVFWKIMSMEENEEKPLSLRSNGSFVCGSLPLAETIFEDDGQSVSCMAEHFLEWSNKQLKDFLQKASKNTFSSFIKANTDFSESGSYSETLICALITENNAVEAKIVAQEIVSGKKTTTMTHHTKSKSFYELAEVWIENNVQPSATKGTSHKRNNPQKYFIFSKIKGVLTSLSTLFSSETYSTMSYPDNFAAISRKAKSKGTAALDEQELLIYVIGWFEAELNNGGFRQYFCNSAGEFAFEAYSSLQKIGAVQTAELFNAAIKIAFNGRAHKDRNERQSLLASEENQKRDSLDELDANFYLSHENIAELVNKCLSTWQNKQL